MYTDAEPPDQNETREPHADTECKESIYRTKWLIAHNRLHDLAHQEVKPGWWADYLRELEFEDTPAELVA